MAKCTKEKELVIRTSDKTGLLEEITGAMAVGGINIVALCAYGMEGNAYIMMVTNNHTKAKQIAETQGWSVEENDVAVVEIHNTVGTAHILATQLKDKNINIQYCYGSTSLFLDDCPCAIVLKAEDIDAVIETVV